MALLQFQFGSAIAAAVSLASVTAAGAQVTLPQFPVSNYGTPGLIDMPTATALPDGALAMTLQAQPHTQRVTLSFQALPRVTLSFRYARLEHVAYRADTGDALFDRSFDLHWQINEEGRYMPAIALGLRDFIGTGAYSGEYIVASRRFSPRMRASLGMGWGRLATHGAFSNPLRVVSNRFETRPRGFSGRGGQFEVDRFFRGPAAVFAGLEYQASERLTLMAEYSSDAYPVETRQIAGTPTRMSVRSPVNLGFRYRTGPGSTVSGYVVGGTTVGVSASFMLNPAQPSHGAVVVTPPAPVRLRSAAPQGGEFSTSWATPAALSTPRTAERLREVLQDEGIDLTDIQLEPRRATLRIANRRHEVLPRAIGRTARLMTRALPDSVEDIVIIPMHGGVAGTAVTLRRSELERLALHPDGAALLLAGTRFADPLEFPGVQRFWQPLTAGSEAFTWSIGPYFSTAFFDPARPVRVDTGLQANLRYRFAENLSINGRISQSIWGNIGSMPDGPNTMRGTRFTPGVRTTASDYYTGRPSVDRLTLDYTLRPAENLFGRVTVGWLERMYAGVSTELLWSPPESRLAFGFELNHVAQRDPSSVLGLNDLRITTGHVSAYYDIGRGFQAQIDAGRYLAGDYGATFRLEREFANGMRVGAYATLTDMPFDVFGEGSFDKGISLTLPVTALIGTPSTRRLSRTIQPINRDGGARLNVPGRLYPTIQESRRHTLERGWGAVFQ